MDDEVGLEEPRLKVLFYGVRLSVSHVHEDGLMQFMRGVRLQGHLAHEGAVRLGDYLDELAVAQVVGESMEPARDGVFRVALRPGGERRTPVETAVLDAIDGALYPLEEETLAEDGLASHLAVGQLMTEEGGIPMVAETKLGLQIPLPRLLPPVLLDLFRDLVSSGPGRCHNASPFPSLAEF